MDNNVTLICRACKKPNAKESKYFLKFYDKQVKVPCSHCDADINVLVNKAFFDNVAAETEEHTQFLIRDQEIWVTPEPVLIYVDNADGFGMVKATLYEGSNVIGRTPKQEAGVNCIRIETTDRSVSRNHLTITTEQRYNGFAYLLKDNSSSNGTYLNDEKLTKYDEVYLEKKDVISAGVIKILMTKR